MSLWDDFVAIVDRQFKYLESDFKFTKVSTEIPFVVYESPLMRINVFWEYGDRYELDLGIKLSKAIDKRGQSIGLDELAQIHNTEGHERYEWLLINTKEKLEIGLQELSGFLLKYGSNLLRGDLHDLEKIEKLREKAAKKYSKKTPPY